MTTVREMVNPSFYGKVILTRSDRFGQHDFLVAKYPGKYFEDSVIFVQLPKGNVLFFSSVADDEFLLVREVDL